MSVTARPRHDFLPEWCAALALVLLDIALCLRTGLHFRPDWGAYWLVPPLLAAAFLLRRRAFRAALLLSYFALLIFTDTAVRVATYAASAMAGPLWDGRVAAFDARLGFDWFGYFHLVADHGVLGWPLGFLYYRIGLFALFFMAVMSLKGDKARLREIWWLLFIASLLTALGAGLFPVLGPYHTYHLQQCCGLFITELEHIRAGASLFPLGALTGVVQCPSFHTTLALALPYAFRGTGPLGLLITVFNALILFAVPVFGGHYLTDMLAGACVLALSLAAVKSAGWLARRARVSAASASPEFSATSGDACSAAAPSR